MRIRWKIALAFPLVIVFVAFALDFAITYRAFGSQAAWAFVVGTVRGTRARPLTSRHFERTPARVARGAYLVGVARCFSCHSDTDPISDWPLPGTEGAGTTRQLTVKIIYPNITSDVETGAGAWTDDMFARAIREGIGHDGRPLIPRMMPYESFRYLSDEDLASIVVYLRSLPPVRHALPKMKLALPFELALKGFPRPLLRDAVALPDTSSPARLGQYLAHICNCADCHDATDRKGHILPYAGGQVIGDHGQKAAAAANITPDPSGISYYDEALFIQTMRTGHVGARELAAAMPWRYYRSFADDDLKSLFAYLSTLKPIKHRVDNTEPPTYCKVCGQRHGGGALN